MLLGLFLIVLGLVFGSFFSALTFRYERGISIAKGRSICPKCKQQIAWFDNIPVISFLVLGGKCRNCKKPISFRYPLVEFFTALGFFYIGYINLPIITTLFLLIVFSILVIIFVIDLEIKIIPDHFIFVGLITVFLKLLLVDNSQIFSGILAGLIASFLLLLVNLLTRGRGMGLGDVKFAFFGGMFIGLNLFLVWLFSAFLTGAVVGIILILVNKARLKSEVPFGPFLIFGLVITYFFGGVFLRMIFL